MNDAQHWVRVYGELLGICERLHDLPAEGIDKARLQMKEAHLRARLDFWQGMVAPGSG